MTRSEATKSDWHARAEALVGQGIEGRAFIDGAYRAASAGGLIPAVSPLDGRVLTQIAACDATDVDLAVRGARAAFADRRWCGQPPARRKAVLLALARLVLEHRDELALLETLDMGKPIGDSTTVDVPAAARCFQWYAETVDKVYGEVAPTADDTLATITREPLGVIAAVVPWNFPLLMASWKVAPALAAGNSVILKPAEQSSLTALRLAALAREAGVPDGVLQVVPGHGVEAGKALGLHPDVDGVFFTGSTEVGKYFMQYAGQSNLKKVGLECGGKSAHIVLADCAHLETAADAAADAIFFNQGEMCTAGSRLVVDRRVKDRVIDRILSRVEIYRPGDPLDPATRTGALVDEGHTGNVLGYIGVGREEGARVLTGGTRARLESGGCFVEPTVFDGVTNAMRIAREEIFGPVLSVITVDGPDEAVAVANDSIYGLAAAVWSDDTSTIHRVAKSLRAGMVYMNCYDADDITVPFGGYKQSGIGRDKSLHALEKYTELKTSWLKLR
jgi:gamma-glutamyl-gamma-aminobutyraldehyde dehydrogenase/4-guanidinobutyraldehyde dehydrogenase/NAD-dependent aldehyde dehydrogenase